jgi:hypothetical protein
MAGTVNAPLATSAFPTVDFFTRLKDSVFGRQPKRAKVRPSGTGFSVQALIDQAFLTISFNETKEMIRASSDVLSDEMVEILACLVADE